MKKTDYTDDELLEIIDTAKELKGYDTRFITCHCTGLPAYKVMKSYMGDQLEYVHSGEEIDPKLLTDKYVSADKRNINVEYVESEKITGKPSKNLVDKRKGGRSFMKLHKFFAWATVACFILTMITGYKRK